MKSDEQIVKLSANPYYTFSEQEQERLDVINSQPKVSSVTVDETKKKLTVTRGNAAVKETGRLEKHSSDPVTE